RRLRASAGPRRVSPRPGRRPVPPRHVPEGALRRCPGDAHQVRPGPTARAVVPGHDAAPARPGRRGTKVADQGGAGHREEPARVREGATGTGPHPRRGRTIARSASEIARLASDSVACATATQRGKAALTAATCAPPRTARPPSRTARLS